MSGECCQCNEHALECKCPMLWECKWINKEEAKEMFPDKIEDKMNKWMRVEDGLPEPMIPVCVIHDGQELISPWITYMSSSDTWFVSMIGLGNVTHWMPLPNPPEEL